MDEPHNDEIGALVERRVSAEEVRSALDIHMGAAEREEILALVRWFKRRYPTGADRLTYVRRAYVRWLQRGRRRSQ